MRTEPDRLIFKDAETFYDSASGYTLKKLTPVEYILDDRFELIMMAVKEGVNGKGYIVDGPDYPRWVKDAQPHRALTATVNWNALFDASICAWRFGYLPGRMLDAMTMCRAIIGHELKSFALANVARYFKLPPKGDMVGKVDGMRRQTIIDHGYGFWEKECEYAMHDNELCAAIWQILSPRFPWSEQRLQDLVIRCTVQPSFCLDKRRLYEYYQKVKLEKEKLLTAVDGIERAELMSSNKFAMLLESKGVQVQRKVTKQAGAKWEANMAQWAEDGSKPDEKPAAPVPVPALARTDTFMQTLVNHGNPEIAALAAARLGLKSTLEETRCKRLLQISMLKWPGSKLPWMPVPLRYAGAHTHRFSGDWSLNEQNMKRKSELRYAHVVPKGYAAIVADLGQIECRVNGWICGETALMRIFRDKGDPYNGLATAIFGFPVNRKLPEHFVEGFIGKTGTLGLGFGCGADRFYGMVLELSYIMGIDLKGKWTHNLAQTAVDTYRRMNPNIKNTWYLLNEIVDRVWFGKQGLTHKFGPVTISHGCILGPNGLEMRYDRPTMKDGEYFYTYGGEVHRMYGAKLLENIVQFLARIILMNAAVRIYDRGFRFALSCHDELVFIVPIADVEKARSIIHEEMTRPPSWAKDIPLTVDIGVGRSYGDAK